MAGRKKHKHNQGIGRDCSGPKGNDPRQPLWTPRPPKTITRDDIKFLGYSGSPEERSRTRAKFQNIVDNPGSSERAIGIAGKLLVQMDAQDAKLAMELQRQWELQEELTTPTSFQINITEEPFTETIVENLDEPCPANNHSETPDNSTSDVPVAEIMPIQPRPQ